MIYFTMFALLFIAYECYSLYNPQKIIDLELERNSIIYRIIDFVYIFFLVFLISSNSTIFAVSGCIILALSCLKHYVYMKDNLNKITVKKIDSIISIIFLFFVICGGVLN